MMRLQILVFAVNIFISVIEGARILAFYPTPSISHQVVFRPLSLELARRGHEVIVITPDPMFPKGKAPANLTELDVHDLSYNVWKKQLSPQMATKIETKMFINISNWLTLTMEDQLKTDCVQKIIKDRTQKFDLIIVEAFTEPALGLVHLFKAPIIQFSSFGGTNILLNLFGAVSHPLLYPTPMRRRIYNLSMWEKLYELYDDHEYSNIIHETDPFSNEVMKRMYGSDVPPLQELRNQVDLLFLNVHPVWDFNRPVPPNVVYLGGLHQNPVKELPKDLKNYLDSSKNGVIYVSFGSNVDPAMFPAEAIQALVNVFSKLPYDVLWKWNHDELTGRTPNIRISKWLPQSDLLRHPKIKLFVTQCGLQSTDEAITAGVPLLAMPVFGDQEFNAEQYIYHGIGFRVDIEGVTEEKFSEGLNKILNNDSYRQNVVRLRTLMRDQPQTPLERAVWWTEYVIRHSGARHMRAPSAGLSIVEYYELKLVFYLLALAIIALVLVASAAKYVYKRLFNSIKVKKN